MNTSKTSNKYVEQFKVKIFDDLHQVISLALGLFENEAKEFINTILEENGK